MLHKDKCFSKQQEVAKPVFRQGLTEKKSRSKACPSGTKTHETLLKKVKPTQSGISKVPSAFQPGIYLSACPWGRSTCLNLLCQAGSHRPCAAFHLHWSDTGDSALPLQGTVRALLKRGDYNSNPSTIMVWLSSRDLWAGKESENYRCPVPMTEPPYISSNKACDNSSINSHSNRSESQLIIAAI